MKMKVSVGHRILVCGVVGSILLPMSPIAYSQAPKPTVDLLLASWKKLSRQLKSVTKYEINGSYTHVAYLKQTLRDDVNWRILRDGVKLHWRFTRTSSYQPKDIDEAAFDGLQWYSSDRISLPGVVSQGQIWTDPVLKMGELPTDKMRAVSIAYPFDLNQLVDQPIKFLGGSLPDVFREREGDLSVTNSVGKQAQDFTLSFKSKTPQNNLPTAVYFTDIEDKFVPRAFLSTRPGVSVILQYTGFQTIDSVAIPNSWTEQAYTVDSAGKSTLVVKNTGRFQVSLPQHIPDDNFRLTFDKSMAVYSQKTGDVVSPEQISHRPKVAKRGTLGLIIGIVVIAFVAIALVIRLRKR